MTLRETTGLLKAEGAKPSSRWLIQRETTGKLSVLVYMQENEYTDLVEEPFITDHFPLLENLCATDWKILKQLA